MENTNFSSNGKTKPIGEVMWYKGKRIKVVEGFACESCCFYENEGCERPYGYGVCTSVLRTDNKNVHYEYVEKQMKEIGWLHELL